ncbi:hypothetical protein BJ085DRAFT_13591 [Dimargaris cristalligena]|uniref:Uncharacterized protein n=1 Tax=Dimargaris cristalligena TaxID=215637 RepID=A0A4P9ZKB5_9FUNG|nr:hypothetical protein BJ085DRAFT_13591 [Dimargaris cristalligena]|eukprot:RKP33525.1 hypothetical protein BJ085DRAFT_13591 [Dimargaris cristalligena]
MVTQLASYNDLLTHLSLIEAEYDAAHQALTASEAKNKVLATQITSLMAHTPSPNHPETLSTSPQPELTYASQVAKPAPLTGPPGPRHTTINTCNPPTNGHLVTATHAFQLPTGPQGYEYIIIPQGHKMSCTEACHSLHVLGIDTAHILDIIFPAHNHTALLVYQQYSPTLCATLKSAKVTPIEDFEFWDPKHLADPKFDNESDATKYAITMEIHHDHCIYLLIFLSANHPHIATAIGYFFAEQGWISTSDIPPSCTNPSKCSHLTNGDSDQDSMDNHMQE